MIPPCLEEPTERLDEVLLLRQRCLIQIYQGASAVTDCATVNLLSNRERTAITG